MKEKYEITGFKVLSLEDSPLDFEIISEKLIDAGYNLQISRVEDASEFTLAIQANTYDIILADYNLPGFNAFEALKLCGKHCPEVPVICVSGSIGEIQAIELLKQGAVDYVLKDRLERLPSAVKRALVEAAEKTDRKKAEDALLKSEERLRDIIFSMADWVWEVDENGKYTYSSQRGAELFDASPEEIIGKTPFDFMPADEAKRVAGIFMEIAEKKAPIIDLENWNLGKDGKKICLLTNGLPIIGSDGQLKGYRGVDKNITDWKRVEQELIKAKEEAEESEQKYKQIFDNTFDIMSVYEVTEDHRFKVITFNQAEEKLIGSLENYQNKYIDECIPPELYNQFKQNYERCIKEEKLIVYEEDISFQNINKTFNTQLIPLKNSTGRVHRIIVISRDVTDNKLLSLRLTEQNEELKLLNIDLTIAKEKAEASDRLKTSFINNISHEIRTPLNGILGFGQLLIDPDFPSDGKEMYYKMLSNSSDRLLNTVTNIMDISLLTSGNQKVVKKEFNPKNLVSEVCAKFEETCVEKGLTLMIQNSKLKNEYTIFSDYLILSKILHQLIDNAIKFTEYGTIAVGFEKNGNELHFLVKDTGIGISEEYKKRIFRDFDQEENADNRKFDGTGIGLSIAKGLVELLNGRISLDSEKGKGSTFYISLPDLD